MAAATSIWVLKNRSRGAVLFGLCAFECHFEALEQGFDAEIEISIGSASTRLPAKAVFGEFANGQVSGLFHVHTHLLDNGVHSLRVRIDWFSGQSLEWPTQNFEVDNFSRLGGAVRADLVAYGTPPILGRVIDSTLYPYGAGRACPWFENVVSTGNVPLSVLPAKSDEDARRHLERWGFCILSTPVPDEMITQFNAEIDQSLETGGLQHRPGSSERIHGAHQLPMGKKIWLFHPVLRFLQGWFQDEPCACQSLLYINGSEQQPHQDTIHLTPYPAGYMCGVWIPLEDVREGAGELVVYPGSHRSPRLTTEKLHLDKVRDDYSSYVAFDQAIIRLIEDGAYDRLVYRPRKGQILVWHENLIHGGNSRLDPVTTRRSLVSHYFAKGAIAYYDSRGSAATLESLC